jgi:hypothetical protein
MHKNNYSVNTSYSCTDELICIENNLPNYNRHIVKLISQYCRSTDKILDFGAGIGTLANLFDSKFNIDCLEINEGNRIKILKCKSYAKLAQVKKNMT